jgi:hypothetical protein
MAKAKSKQKKRKQANLSNVRKKGTMKKKATTKVRKGGKKKAVRRKAGLHVLKQYLVLRHSPRLHLKK